MDVNGLARISAAALPASAMRYPARDASRATSAAQSGIEVHAGPQIARQVAPVLIAFVCALAALLFPARAQAQATIPMVYKGELEGIESHETYCQRDTMNTLLGPPISKGEVKRPVHTYSFHFLVRSEDGKKREPLFVGIYSFYDVPAAMNLGRPILETLQIPSARAVLKDVKSCPPVYTADPARKTSYPHSNLLAPSKRSLTPEGMRLEVMSVMALYVGRAKEGAGTVLPPVGSIGPSDDDTPPAAPPPKQPQAKGPSGDDAPPPAQKSPAAPDPAPPQRPAAPIPPKVAAPAPAPAAPDKASPAAPKQAAPALSAEALAKEQANCARGEQLACMIVERYKALSGAPKAAPADPSAAAPKADAAAPPAAPAPRKADPHGTVPPPQVAAPAAPPPSAQPPPPAAANPQAAAPAPGNGGAAGGKGSDNGAAAGTASGAPDPKAMADPAGAKQAKRYPAPAYTLVEQPVAALGKEAREAFVVESIECSEEGNLLVGFAGELKAIGAGKGELTIRSRIAINNYPSEGRSKREQLETSVPGFACEADGRQCSAPRKSIPLIEYRRLIGEGGSSPAGDPTATEKEWRCIADKGVCFSRQSDHWRCEPATGYCISHDDARMWCVPRREFCSQGAPFGDWGSPFKAGDRLSVRIAPSVDGTGSPIRDANGNAVYENHVYDMSHGLVRIAEDALMRRCAGYAGPSRTWNSIFPSN